MESSMHDVKILQSENPRVPTDRHQTSLSNRNLSQSIFLERASVE